MSDPKTLLAMAGAPQEPGRLADAALVLIDCQNEYLDGMLPLTGIVPALEQCAVLLDKARAAGTPVIHIVHKGRAGGPFDLDGRGGAICDLAAARDGETVISKPLPNAFAQTGLDATLEATGRKEVIFAGFQTHMCVSSTVRAALDLGYRSTVVAGAVATRDLPRPGGGVMPAADLHTATLAALADRFAIVAGSADDIA